MRIACSSTLLPPGKRFRVSRTSLRRLLALAAAAAVFSVSGPASAAVTVRLEIGVTAPKAPQGAVTKACSVPVSLGSNGIDVLDAAVASGCIGSYQVDDFGFDAFVRCLDDRCADPTVTTYWAMTENGVYTDYGVRAFRAGQGDALSFWYTTWASCLTPLGC